MKILYNNLIPDATLTASTENPDYTFDAAFNDSRLSRYARTTDDAAEYLVFTFSGAVTASDFCIMGHNITSGATITLQANTSDAWTTPAYSLSITSSDLFGSAYYVNFTEQEYQYWRLYIDDSSNPDGYIQIAYIFLGEALALPGMNPGMITPIRSSAEAVKSPTGQLYGEKRIQLRGAEFVFTEMSDTEKKNFETFIEAVDLVTPFVLLVWEDDLDVQPPVYCALTEIPGSARSPVRGLRWNMSLKVEECK